MAQLRKKMSGESDILSVKKQNLIPFIDDLDI